MKIYKVGDTQKAICEECKGLESVTYQLRDVPVSDGLGLVKNVLAGICDQCDCVAVLPHQSTPLVKKHIENKKASVEARVPAHMIDILNLASVSLTGDTGFVPHLLKFYIHSLSSNQISKRSIIKFLASDLFIGKADKRLSLKGKSIADEIDLIKSELQEVTTTTDLLKGITLKIKEDILENKKPKISNNLKTIAATV
ncbi:MAG: hypothetical protein KTR16_01980 [Acidiferrobacterales bacterium]|nr:hypothetical protein [Acidiferrobacterales bacterium]